MLCRARGDRHRMTKLHVTSQRLEVNMACVLIQNKNVTHAALPSSQPDTISEIECACTFTREIATSRPRATPKYKGREKIVLG